MGFAFIKPDDTETIELPEEIGRLAFIREHVNGGTTEYEIFDLAPCKEEMSELLFK